MAEITLHELLTWTGGALLNGEGNFSRTKIFQDISTDTRHIADGSLFVALRGARFDGHHFLNEALANGAAGLVIENDDLRGLDNLEFIPVVKVENTLAAYQHIAAGYRNKLSAMVIAVTGSVGKTMTRRMISCCLEAGLSVHQTAANLNNEIGLPQTILAAKPENKALVLELGMRGQGEISLLSRISRPEIAVITNIGWAHIGRLGSRENILKAKTEIVDGMQEGGLLVVNADDPLLLDWSRKTAHGRRLAMVMKNRKMKDLTGAEFYAWAENIADSDSGIAFTGCLQTREGILAKADVELDLPGEHNITNALFGLAAAYAAGVDLQAAADNLANCVPPGNRQQIIRQSGYLIMDDSYNAGPESMESALQTLARMAGGKNRLIAVLGGMLELGEFSLQAHKEIGSTAARQGYSSLFLIGEYALEVAAGAKEIDKGIHLECFTDKEELTENLASFIQPGDYILIKGSRAYGMEKITALLLEIISCGKSGKEGKR